MKVFVTILVVILILAGSGAVFVWSGVYNVAADEPHWKVTSWIIEQARERSIEVRSDNLPAPPDIDPASVDTASYEYHGTCQMCHGAPGSPPNRFTRAMNPKPPLLLTGDGHLEMDDREAYWVIKHGIKMTGMAAFGEVLEERVIWGLVGYLKKAGKPQGRRSG